MSKNRIPTAEEFARVEAIMAENDRGLSDICEYLMNKYKGQGIHEVFLFYDQDTDTFYPIIFYNYDNQIWEAQESGLKDKIKKDVLQALEDFGRGNKDTINVEFEFDSHENVVKNYEGDYFLRLR